MLEDPADRVQAHLAQAGVLVAREQRLVPLPQREVHVHPRAVVLEQRLGHERDDLAVAGGDVLADVLVHHHVVGHRHQVLVAHVDFALPAGGDLVVMRFDRDAQLDQRRDHLAADVLHRVHRRRGEVPLLQADLVAEVDRVLVAAAPDALAAADVVLGEVDPLVVEGLVEDEELQLRAEVGRVGDLGLLQELRPPCGRWSAGRGSIPSW